MITISRNNLHFMNSGWAVTDPESNMQIGKTFDQENYRRSFVRKVFSILSAQLLITAAIVALFMFEPTVNQFTRQHVELVRAAFGLYLILTRSSAKKPAVNDPTILFYCSYSP